MLSTFPHIADQLRYVYYGTEGYNAEGIDVYGNPDRESGAARHRRARRHAGVR